MIQCQIRPGFTLAAASGPAIAVARYEGGVSYHRCPGQSRSRSAKARRGLSGAVVACVALAFLGPGLLPTSAAPSSGLASWYGEEHRGKLMANGKRFNPDKFTAASWFYPLGSRVRVTLAPGSETQRSVVVTITDRGPAREFMRDGRIIDLSHAPFRRLAPPLMGLVPVAVERVR